MKTRIFAFIFLALATFSCKDDFLEKPPLDQLADDSFWTNENNVRTFSYEFYPGQFTGYGVNNTWGNFFSGQSLNDDFAPYTPTEYTRVVPASGGGWSFTTVRRANLFIDRVEKMPVTAAFNEETKNHWIGVGRFFRALEYFNLVKRFGDVPWYVKVLEETDIAELYKPRDSRTFVMDKVLADFKFAAEHVRLQDGTPKQSVNKDVVLAFMSRAFLFEGTWQKYHENNTSKAAEYLEAAKWAANEIITSGRYRLGNYRDVFSSLNLAGNPEVILYRQYEPGVLTHALMGYNNREPQNGASKDVIETYLAKDGLPIQVSPLYQGDKGIDKVMADRDPRLTETFVRALRVNGNASNYSSTGYASHKFLNESIKDDPTGSLALNPTDAPIIRYGEVLVNYAEAAAELATVGGPVFEDKDLNQSINILRARPGIGLPALQVEGNQPKANGIVYNDPDRDPSVSPIIWEIRRERRVELIFEGFRFDDLRRWKKLEYTDTQANPDINRGAWIKKADYSNLNASVYIENNQPEGYIVPAWKPEVQRRFSDPRIYLYPLPQDQIIMYREQGGTELKQNPGW